MAEKLPVLPRHASKWLRYVIAFSVTLAVRLAPLLGRVRIPGFSPIIELFPVNVRAVAVPFAAFVMAIPAVLVQYFAGERIRFFRPRFVLSLALTLFALLLILFYLYGTYVIQVQTIGGAGSLSYIVGSKMKTKCECMKKQMDIVPCIGRAISTSSQEVDDCDEDQELRRRKILLSMTHIVMTACFGALVGILVLKENEQPPSPQRRKASKRKKKAQGVQP